MANLTKKQSSQTKEEDRNRHIEELYQMEEELGGILVAGPNPKHRVKLD